MRVEVLSGFMPEYSQEVVAGMCGGGMCERKCMCKPGSQVSLKEKVNWGAKGDYAGNTARVTTCRSFSNANLGGSRFYQGKLCVPSPLPEVLLPTRSLLFKGHLLILQNASL